MSLYYNNKSTISISNNHVQHDQTKYIEVDRNFILCGLICIPFITTDQQLAAVLMRFHDIINKLGKVVFMLQLEGEC